MSASARKAFVGHLTLEHAKAELADGASVLDAALDAGLSGPSRLHDLALKIEAMTPGDYAKGGAGLAIEYGFHDCPFGIALVMATPRGVCGLGFGDEGEEAAMLADMSAAGRRRNSSKTPARTAAIARRRSSAPETGRAPLGLHLLGTPWQIKVWQALLAIPSGKVTTYRAIAEKLAAPKRVARGGHRGRPQSDFAADPVPSRAGQRRRLARLSLGADAQARDAGGRSRARASLQAERPRTSAMP